MNYRRRSQKDLDVDMKHSPLWMLQPILFICALFYLYQNPDTVLNVVPNLTFWSSENNNIDNYVQHIPTDLYTVWRLGQLSDVKNNDALNEASKLANWHFSSPDELEKLGDLLKDYETKHVSLPARIWGFLNFVNLLWIISIVGILITLYPCLSVILAPFARLFAELFMLLVRLLITLKPFLEPLGYIISYIIIVQSFRYQETVGLFVALTGITGFVGMYFYSGKVHEVNPEKDVELKQFFFFATIALANVPLALHFDSRLFGYATVITAHMAVGFSVACYGLCYVIGFQDRYALQRSVVASLITIPLFFVMRNVPEFAQYCGPFMHPVYVFSSIVYLLGLLIVSSSLYYSRSNDHGYFSAQLMMISSLLAFTFSGSVYGIQSFFNVSTTFAVLYLMEKTLEMELFRDAGIVAIFFMFVAMYFASMFLYTHPGFLMSLFIA